MLKKVTAQSLLLVLLPFFLYYMLSILFDYSIPKALWPIENREYALNTNPLANVYDLQRLWQNFDSNYYMEIVTKGYVNKPFTTEEGLLNWGFFPLYPLIVGVIGRILSISSDTGFFYVGVVVSNVFLFFSYIFLYTLLKRIGLEYKDWLVMSLLIIFFPAAYFKQIFYTESLYLFLSLLCLNLIFAKRFLYASFAIAFLGLTRLYGLTLFIPLFVYQLIVLIESKSKRYDLLLLKNFFFGLISISLLLLFFGYLYTLTGEFLAPLKMQASNRGGGLIYPFKSIVEFFNAVKFSEGNTYLNWVLNVIVSLAVFASLFYLPFSKKIEKKYSIPLFLYGIFYMLLPLSTKDNLSIFRYISVLFPFYLVLHLLAKNKSILLYLILFMFALLQSYFLLLFVGHYVIPTYGI